MPDVDVTVVSEFWSRVPTAPPLTPFKPAIVTGFEARFAGATPSKPEKVVILTYFSARSSSPLTYECDT